MSNPDGYVREINSIKQELKRLTQRSKMLRKQQAAAKLNLFHYMDRHGLTKYNGITIKSITPREKVRRKPQKQKQQDAIALFEEIGIPHAQEFYQEFLYTQRYVQ